MGFLAAMLPIGAAAHAASRLFARRSPDATETEFARMLHQTMGQRVVQHLDSDGDGLLTPTEFSGDAELFAQWDANRDGVLSSTEIDTGMALHRQWQHLNSNGDDTLTQHELGVTKDRFNAIDQNGDALVSRDEYFATYREGAGS